MRGQLFLRKTRARPSNACSTHAMLTSGFFMRTLSAFYVPLSEQMLKLPPYREILNQIKGQWKCTLNIHRTNAYTSAYTSSYTSRASSLPRRSLTTELAIDHSPSRLAKAATGASLQHCHWLLREFQIKLDDCPFLLSNAALHCHCLAFAEPTRRCFWRERFRFPLHHRSTYSHLNKTFRLCFSP